MNPDIWGELAQNEEFWRSEWRLSQIHDNWEQFHCEPEYFDSGVSCDLILNEGENNLCAAGEDYKWVEEEHDCSNFDFIEE